MHVGNVYFFDAEKCIVVVYILCCQMHLAMNVSSMLSNALRQCMFLRCCQMNYGNVRFFDAVKYIMAMYVSSMQSDALWHCGFLSMLY